MSPQIPSTSTFSLSSLQQTLVNTSAARTYSSGFSKPNLPRSSSSSGYNSTLVSSSGSSIKSTKSSYSSHSISSGSSARTLDAEEHIDEQFQGLKLISSNPLPLAVPAAQTEALAHEPQGHKSRSRFSSLFSSSKSKSKSKSKSNPKNKSSNFDSRSEKRRPPPLDLGMAGKKSQARSSGSANGKAKPPKTPLFDWKFRNHTSMAVQGTMKAGGQKRPAGWGLLLQG